MEKIVHVQSALMEKNVHVGNALIEKHLSVLIKAFVSLSVVMEKLVCPLEVSWQIKINDQITLLLVLGIKKILEAGKELKEHLLIESDYFIRKNANFVLLG